LNVVSARQSDGREKMLAREMMSRVSSAGREGVGRGREGGKKESVLRAIRVRKEGDVVYTYSNHILVSAEVIISLRRDDQGKMLTSLQIVFP
jgi:hypothetical protein